MVRVTDSDDQGPKFSHESYSARVVSGAVVAGLEVQPEKIKAFDQDTLRAHILYSISDVRPSSMKDNFVIGADTGVVTQTSAVDRSDVPEGKIMLVIKAEEQTPAKRSAEVELRVIVAAEDSNPPVLMATASVGYVEEGATIGSRVVDDRGNDIKFAVTDMDRYVNDA
jgi:hypothetical protein